MRSRGRQPTNEARVRGSESEAMGVSEQLQEASLKNTTLVGERESLATAQPGTEVGDSLAELWRSGYVCAHLRHSSPINLSQPYFRCEFGATPSCLSDSQN